MFGVLYRSFILRVGVKVIKEFINEFFIEEFFVLNRVEYTFRIVLMLILVFMFCFLDEFNKKFLFNDLELENIILMLCTSFL